MAPQRAPGAGGGGGTVVSRGGFLTQRAEPADITPIISLVKGQLPGWFGTGGPRTPVGINFPRVSVGEPKVPLAPSGAGIPQFPPANIGTPTFTGDPLPEPVIRQDPTPVRTGIPVQQTIEIAGYKHTGTLQFLRTIAIEAGDSKAVKTIEALMRQASVPTGPKIIRDPVPASKQKEDGPLDLGDIVKTLGTTYIQTKYAPEPVVQAQPAYSVFDAGSDIIDYFTDPGTGAVVPVKKKKPCRRRRRRRLATKSDLGDLAALKAILGNGEAFKAWIATHSR